MPSNETAKTKWAPKRLGWIVLLCIFLALLTYVIIVHLVRNDPPQPSTDKRTYTMTVEGAQDKYRLQAVSSIEDQERGLSGSSKLDKHAGMIFVHNEVAERCFWMKDMNYPLDIIWADDKKQVVHIEADVSPTTYPHAFCALAQYVIELNAGRAAHSGITKGMTLGF
jgi:uncharacterized membrane protein (UPF0127 family)